MNKSVIVNKSCALKGNIEVSGAKNSILPIICASLLTDDVVELSNVPDLNDVHVLIGILEDLGKRSMFEKDKLTLYPTDELNINIPIFISETASKIRYSILILGALLAKGHEVSLPLPGGCSFSERPIDIHLEGLRKLGATIEEHPNKIIAKSDRLKGAHIKLRFPSVGATENLVIASTLAQGVTIIENAAREPEIEDLINFLNSLGAKIEIEEPGKIKIIGVESLIKKQSIKHKIIPDRIEAATFIILGAIAAEDFITIKKMNVTHNLAFLNLLQKIGVKFEIINNSTLKVYKSTNLIGTKIETDIYPSIATDIQPLLAVLLTQAKGESTIIDSIYPSRFQYIKYLNLMGANIQYLDSSEGIKIIGETKLYGHKVLSTDLRGGAAVLLAGILAENTTIIENSYQIFRGYSDLENKLLGLNVRLGNSSDKILQMI
ncbi:UDP-N-acetylglucosamine 1-carboxyvinyltransferase [Neobacillus sp. OS1-33]|uniref:UDP-N-acetylglucosamine 1-carboxyvinyltransferase n=1 Tax=Neobacillus sp. OS1-33 TaxID=3070683 RepID=UPI0027DEDCD6|nr:UDP-N-acetylglucosamine 1-carboxyvinyltransferase [Neobacillus sp. OS1-33]WML24563.1 UDP-N-acetylglucosamine 1-carboxyvinyltransferase [Neobacillus sp. OS1-33]